MALTAFTGFEGWKTGTFGSSTPAYAAAPSGVPQSISANSEISETTPHSGLKCFRANVAAGTKFLTWNTAGSGIGSANTSELALSFYVKAENLPNTATTVSICYINCDTISDFEIQLITAGVNSTSATIRAKWGANTVDVGTINEGGDWMRISFALALNGAGTKTSTIVIDGGAEQTGPTMTGTGTFNAAGVINLGAYTSGTYAVLIDDVAIFNAAADLDSLGDYGTFGNVPTSDGTHSITAGYVTTKGGVNITNASVDAYTHIDVPAFDSADTTDLRHAISGTESTGRVAFKFGAPSIAGPATIHAVALTVWAAPTAGSRTIQAAVFNGTTSVEMMPARTIAVARTGGYAVSGLRTTGPDSAAWELDQLENMEFRVWSASAIMVNYGVNYEVLYSEVASSGEGETGQLARSRHWNSFQVRVKSGGTAGNLGVSAVGSA